MTENEFYRKALLAIAGNSAFKPDYYKQGQFALRYWAKEVEQAATELLEVATAEHCGVDETEDVTKVTIVSTKDKPP